MKSTLLFFWVTILILLLIAAGCDSSDTTTTQVTPTFNQTPTPIASPSPTPSPTFNNTLILELPPECILRDNAEADNMAILLSEELYAPDALYNLILDDLAAIRSTFGDEIEQVNRITFRSADTSSLMVAYDEEALENGYNLLNELKEGLHFVQEPVSGGSHVLHFQCRFHPQRLAEILIQIPGIKWVSPYPLVGDGPTISPLKIGDTITYLFRDAWGDCPAGCTYSEFWYFKFDELHQPVFVGHYDPQSENPPDWWTELEQYNTSYLHNIYFKELWSSPTP